MSTTTIEDNAFFALFCRQKKHQYILGNSTYKERIKTLTRLQIAISKTYRVDLKEAIFKDFKKPYIETDLTEIFPIISEIKYAKRKLKQWMGKHYAKTPIPLLGSSSWTTYEPKGVCLIISPWNFPINLTFGPLVSAIAAGNTVIIKPSEHTPHTSEVMEKLVKTIFKEEEITLIQGEATISQELLQLPFNHIFFTGAPNIGKVVMKAAAEHLSSITLELGGKSPTIVDTSAHIKTAAKRIAWGKCVNNGQVCVAPDYLLIHSSIKDKFVKEFKKQVTAFYLGNTESSTSYCRIVNDHHFMRLQSYIKDANEQGAILEYGGDNNKEDRFISPTILSNIPESALVLKEEIFGPILPIITYNTIEECIAYINKKEKPLALYIFSKTKKNIKHILKNTRAGTSCINTTTIQFSNYNLPFGGINNSGIGKAHGFYGFQEFSNCRAILKQNFKGVSESLYPPYGKLKQKLINLTIKWF